MEDVCDRIDLLGKIISTRARELSGIEPVDRGELSEKLAAVWESRDYGVDDRLVAPDVLVQHPDSATACRDFCR